MIGARSECYSFNPTEMRRMRRCGQPRDSGGIAVLNAGGRSRWASNWEEAVV